jgi:hypothetical protein
LGAQLLELSSCSCQLLDRDQAPVTVSLLQFDPVDGRSLAARLSRYRRRGRACAVAHIQRVRPYPSGIAASTQSVDRYNSFDWAASPLTTQPSAYRYHGGLKSNDTIDTQ